MKKILIIILLITMISCSTTKPLYKTRYPPPIPIEKLHSRGIVPYNANYKSSYYSMLPYLYYNKGDDFIGIKGDFFSIRHPSHKSVNLMVGFWTDYGKYKNILLALVFIEPYNLKVPDTSNVQVSSSKHGMLSVTHLNNNSHRQGFREDLLFTKQIDLEKRADIIKKIYDDVITVTVDGYDYVLLNPELELD